MDASTKLPDRNKQTSIARKLYVSHFLSTWNMRHFEFGAVLFLADLYPGTLLPLSVYAFSRAFAAVIFSPFIGHFIDSTDRLISIRLSIVGQRTAVIVSCIIFWLMLRYGSDLGSIANVFSLVILSFLASVEKLCAILSTVAIERDWVVTIAGDDEGYLQRLNAQMRRIDLFCKLVGPLIVALIDGVSPSIAVLFTTGLNILSVISEYALIANVYHAIVGLRDRPNETSRPASGTQESPAPFKTIKRSCVRIGIGFKSYIYSPAFLPSFSLSLLYLTVLSFSGQMTTYLLTKPMITPVLIGVIRMTATLLELSSTWIAPWLTSRIGAIRAGIWCLSWQIFCISIAVSTFWYQVMSKEVIRTIVFISFIILSRTGLYSFDLVAQLIVQGNIPATQRGLFSATEASIQNFFELLIFLATIILPRPSQFVWPVCVSFGAVCSAGAIYAKYVRDQRGHLLHIPCNDWAKNHWNDDDDSLGGYELLERSDRSIES